MSTGNRDLVRHLGGLELSEAEVMAVPLSDARAVMAGYRAEAGFIRTWVRLLTAPSGNLKLAHSDRVRVAGYGLSLAPAGSSGGWNTCRYAGECVVACLGTAGNGRYSSTQRARVWKTRMLGEAPLEFLRCLAWELDRLPVEKWAAAGFTVSFRFNVLSDIPWETVGGVADAGWLVRRLRDRGVSVYDYSKWPSSRRDRSVALDAGYLIVDSVTERHSDADIAAMENPVVVVDVTRSKPLPATWAGRPAVDADIHDARFLPEERGTVRLLRYKEVTTTKRAAAVASGFVRSVTPKGL